MFKHNVGSADRIVRAVVGLALIAMAIFGEGMAWGWIGVVPLATSLVSYCPAYHVFGLNTCARKARM